MFLLKTFKIRKKDYIVQAGSLVSTGQLDMESDEKFPTAQLHTIIKLFNIPEHVMSQVSIIDVPQGAKLEISTLNGSMTSPAFDVVLRKDFKVSIHRFTYEVTNIKRLKNSYIQTVISNFETKLQNSNLVHNLTCHMQKIDKPKHTHETHAKQ